MGKAIVETLSKDLQNEFPGIRGFGTSNLWAMAQFFSEYEGSTILRPLVGEISWSKHLVIMTKCKEEQERQFYILATKKFGWTKDLLINKIEAKNYEKYLVGQTNLEQALIQNIRSFLVEFGTAFTFVGNQYRIEIEGEEYFIDLLLYHRKLQAMVAVELKIGKFLPEYKGKMEFYLNVLNDTVKLPHENPSIGIIICKSKKRTIVEYALKDSNQPIGIATYSLTSELPDSYQEILPDGEEIARRINLLMEK